MKKEILLNQFERRYLNLRLSPNVDFTVLEVNPDVVTFEKAQRALVAKGIPSENAKIILTPTKNGFSGEPLVLFVKVRKLPITRLDTSVSLVALKENHFVDIGITAQKSDFTFSSNNDNITIKKIHPYRIRVTAIQIGESNITITASASGKAPNSITIPVAIIADKDDKKFYFGQIPTSSGFDWVTYDANPERFNFEALINQSATEEQLQEFDSSDIVDANVPFTPRLNETNSFVYFVFEKGSESIELNSSADFNPLSKYPISPRTYEITKDLGRGETTYTVLITPTYRQSMPSLYVRNMI